MYGDNIVGIFWFLMSYFSQLYSKFITNITSENVFQVRTTECRTRLFIFEVDLNFLRSSRNYDNLTTFAVIVSVLSEHVHGIHFVLIGRVITGFQIVRFLQLRMSYIQNCELPLCNTLVS